MPKKSSLSDENVRRLESLLFTSIRYQDRTCWIKDRMSKEDYLTVRGFNIKWEDKSPVPSRYLNPHSFQSYLSLLSTTTRICQLFHLLSSVGCEVPSIPPSTYLDIEGYRVSTTYDDDPDEPTGPTDTSLAEFNLIGGEDDPWQTLMSLILCNSSAASSSSALPGFVCNNFVHPKRGFISAGHVDSIVNKGLIFSFMPQLAEPCPNLVGDILGRHFLTLLGGSFEDQSNNLDELRAGLGNMRLTEVGDELSHLYKCIDVAINAHCGLVPIFSGNYYEGCVLMGGTGADFLIRGEHVVFEEVSVLKQQFLTASSHSLALSNIASLLPVNVRGAILACTDMVTLRAVCVDLEVSGDNRDQILSWAANLRFSQTVWPISPAMLKRSLALLSNINRLDATVPISRLCLFSKDPVLIALSVFGEKSAPSWNVPNGTTCRVGETPPSIPSNVNKGGSSRGTISDATWVMTVRRTDLRAAAEDFREMAKIDSYRSLPSVQARNQGFLTFSRDRMMEYWQELKLANRVINPVDLIETLDASLKRSAIEIDDDETGGVPLQKSKKLRF